MSITSQSLIEIRNKLAGRQVSAREVTQACLDKIQQTEPTIHALLYLDTDAALKRAEELDKEGPSPKRPLFGVPVAIKDCICAQGMPTTSGSRMLEAFKPPYNAHVVSRLQEAGAVILGKTNMDEFAMGSTTTSSAFGPTGNPLDPAKTPGGSSGGSAASVAARQCFASLGTDTGGSVRQPAAMCGIVGLRPTYGRVSRFGVVPCASSMDQVGPMARTAEDLAALFNVIAGPDEKDATCADLPLPDLNTALSSNDLKGLRIGIPKEYWADDLSGLDSEVLEACRQTIETAKTLGAQIVPVSLPLSSYSVAAYYIIAMAEGSSNMSMYDGIRFGQRAKNPADLEELYEATRSLNLGTEVKKRIIIGTYVLSAGFYDAYYRKAAQVRRLILEDFEHAFQSCDIIAGPTSPTTAFPLDCQDDDPLHLYLIDIFTSSPSLAGIPSLSFPAGLGQNSKMPVGMQITAPAWREDLLFRLAGTIMRHSTP